MCHRGDINCLSLWTNASSMQRGMQKQRGISTSNKPSTMITASTQGVRRHSVGYLELSGFFNAYCSLSLFCVRERISRKGRSEHVSTTLFAAKRQRRGTILTNSNTQESSNTQKTGMTKQHVDVIRIIEFVRPKGRK